MELFLVLVVVFGPSVLLLVGVPRLWNWCQKKIHLSTAVVILLVVGALLGTNLSGRRSAPTIRTDHGAVTVQQTAYGFPFTVIEIIDGKSIPDGTKPENDVDGVYEKLPNGNYRYDDDAPFNLIFYLWDTNFALLAMAAAVFGCEGWIRRFKSEEISAVPIAQSASSPSN